MSVLHPGDEDMHYSDHSHRWIAPKGLDQRVWAAAMRDHMRRHLAAETAAGGGGKAGHRGPGPVSAVPTPRRRPDVLTVGPAVGNRIG